jgi:hypothetical protein
MADYHDFGTFEPISAVSPVRDEHQVLLSRWTTTLEQLQQGQRHLLALMTPEAVERGQLTVKLSRKEVGSLVICLVAQPEKTPDGRVMVPLEISYRSTKGAEIHYTPAQLYAMLHSEVTDMVDNDMI